jgi:Methyltransferase domain
MDDFLNSYLNRGQSVHGWLHQYSAAFIADLSRIQRNEGITGAVGEIGVHMGRLFILLKLTATPAEKVFAIDVFSEQHLNVDHSGFGDRNVFLHNVRQWTGNDDVTIFQASSMTIRADEIIGAVGPCRLVSIDGGHTDECTSSDLRLTESILVDSGVAILDDFFNQSWPGVASAASKYFLDPETRLRAFAISPNKLYLSSTEFHGLYREFLRKSQANFFDKTVHMFGNDVDIFGCQERRVSLRKRIRNVVRKSRLWSA